MTLTLWYLSKFISNNIFFFIKDVLNKCVIWTVYWTKWTVMQNWTVALADLQWYKMQAVVALVTVLCFLGVSCWRQSPPKNSLGPPFYRGTSHSNLTIGLILPRTMFNLRGYNKAISDAVNGLHRSKGPKFTFLKKYQFTSQQVNNQMFSLTPSPTGNVFVHIFSLNAQ